MQIGARLQDASRVREQIRKCLPLLLAAGLLTATVLPPLGVSPAFAQQYDRTAMQQALETKSRYDLYGIHFDSGTATMQPEAASLIDDIAEMLGNFPQWRLRITGHTDSTGDAAANETLSVDRAEAIAAELVGRGIDASRLETEGAGQDQPLATNDTEEGRALNRRVELARLDAKPNIVVIWGDDIGLWNLSAYSRGAMGYRTPNMTTVGSVGSKQGLRQETVTLAEVLKEQGYATGQFGKNHLGDRNEHLPTVHGFDEFMGNLYHLNTQEESEDVDYPTDPAFKAAHGTRGVLHCVATASVEPGEDPRFGPWGRQRCEDTGQLTRKRMEHVDEEFIDASFRFMDKAVTERKPFFVWIAASRMHTFTRAPAEYLERCKQYTSGDDVHCAGMLQHDENVGSVLKKLDDLGVSDNTIVIYSTDNGPEHSTWPHGGTTPYRSEKMTTWEGGVRVPMMVRWPGHVRAGSELNGIQSHEDAFTTLAAAAGVPDVRERAAAGDKFGTETVKKNYIDGVNNLDYWTGKSTESARDHFFYYSESRLQALRFDQWKFHFYVRDGYYGASQKLEMAQLYNIRQDPFESYGNTPGPRATLQQQKLGQFHRGVDLITAHLNTLKEFSPVQKGASLSVGEVMEQVLKGAN